jgi:L-threonylcarbamoyladenylate synthase
MTSSYDLSVSTELLTGMRAARGAIGRGELVVMPTDTVYGLAADAFRPCSTPRAEAGSRRRPSWSRGSTRWRR